MTYFYYLDFPIFDLKISHNDGFISRVEFLEKALKLKNITNNILELKIIDQLNKYLKNKLTNFDLPLKIDEVSSFQNKVLMELKKIEYSKTKSYLLVAKEINSSPRAIGNACGKNPIPIFIPCHRVINSNGKFGGFLNKRNGFALTIKKWLLAHEQSF